MRPSKQSVFELFDRQRRYVVPLFQRPYVWNREQQWEPLWEDIASKATPASEGNPYPHFLGAVVLNQVKVYGKSLDTAEVIDGQQRLTTLQVFLAAFRDVAMSTGAERLADALSDLTANRHIGDDAVEQFKVWPTNADREFFRAVMTVGSSQGVEERFRIPGTRKASTAAPRLVEAYLYFEARILDFANGSDAFDGSRSVDARQRLDDLFDAVRRRLHLVVIELEDEDDPQTIFETLNARGVPLLPSDLIRNFVFLRAARQGEDQEVLYNRWWRHYDERPSEERASGSEAFWKREEKQGRFKRPRLDLFFQHYLTYATEKDIALGHLFQSFREWWDAKSGESRTVGSELETFRRHSDVFADLIVPRGEGRLALFARRIKALDTSMAYPIVLLLVVGRRNAVADEDLEGILTDIESYLVRRMVCNLTTKGYNIIFRTLLRTLRTVPVITRDGFRANLLEASGDSSRWPDDREFERSWLSQPLYRLFKSPRVSMILQAIDLALTTDRQEVVHLPHSLSVEHVMPIAWRDVWSDPASDSMTAESHETPQERRDRLIHTIGNLTLLTQKLNGAVSNGHFSMKRPAITQQSALRLNSYFQRVDWWDEEGILARGRELFQTARAIWPHPGAGAESSEAPAKPHGVSVAERIEEGEERASSDAHQLLTGEGTVLFVDDDEGYRAWIAENPSGYVLSTDKPSYGRYHRATCSSIGGDGSEPVTGAAWVRGRVRKVCATELAPLVRWARQNLRSEGVKSCSWCAPA